MKRKLFWRSVLRRPLAAVLIVLLLGAAALGVGEKFTEYSAVSSQVDALNDYYRPIGQLVSTDGDVGAGAELISSSAYVDFLTRGAMSPASWTGCITRTSTAIRAAMMGPRQA